MKRRVRDAAFTELEEIKAEPIRVKHLKNTNILKQQEYLVSDKLDMKGKSDLFNLRSEGHRMFRDNFHNMFNTEDRGQLEGRTLTSSSQEKRGSRIKS